MLEYIGGLDDDASRDLLLSVGGLHGRPGVGSLPQNLRRHRNVFMTRVYNSRGEIHTYGGNLLRHRDPAVVHRRRHGRDG